MIMLAYLLAVIKSDTAYSILLRPRQDIIVAEHCLLSCKNVTADCIAGTKRY